MTMRSTRERAFDLLRRAQGIARLERRADRLEVSLDRRFNTLEYRLDEAENRLERDVVMMLRAIVSEDAENRRRLWQARADPAYEVPFTEVEPLVSVIVPTFERLELLLTRSLPSILNQRYRNLEVLVIGDHVGTEFAQALASLGDDRVVFHNLTQRLPPDPDPTKRWMTGAVMPRNEGLRLARGSWLVSFDDDDEMYPSAVDNLVQHARRERVEVAYGDFRSLESEGPRQLGGFPPRRGQFTWQSAVVHRSLSFFERELFAAHFWVPNDFFLAEAMLRAGVRFGALDEIVCDLYPSQSR
ncbi:MAG: glycosyltransferase family 2 protein [Solirubrobacterales bacterium]|nr:glycosyltransferase family 2 protein [Solirubrobacterales bacterium]